MKNILTVIVAASAFFNINAETLTLTPGSISAGIAADAAPAELIIKGKSIYAISTTYAIISGARCARST